MFENVHFVWTFSDIAGLVLLGLLIIGGGTVYLIDWIRNLLKRKK